MNPDGWPSQAVRSVPGRPNPSMSPAYDDCREIAREAGQRGHRGGRVIVDTNLATLRDWIGDPEDYSDEDRGAAERACDACDGVEAELSRLREQRDALRADYGDALKEVDELLDLMDAGREHIEPHDPIAPFLSAGWQCPVCDRRGNLHDERCLVLEIAAVARRRKNGNRRLVVTNGRLRERVEAAEARCARLEAERNEYAERLQWLRDLREREGSWGKPYERAMAASDPRGGEPYQCEEERDRLAERCARLQQALDTLMAEAQHHNLWWLENRIREALAAPDTPADSPPPMPEACPYCSCLTYRLVNNSLHMDAPDGAVICDNCGKGWVHSVDEHGLIPADSQEDKT